MQHKMDVYGQNQITPKSASNITIIKLSKCLLRNRHFQVHMGDNISSWAALSERSQAVARIADRTASQQTR